MGLAIIGISVFIGIWEIPDSFFYYVLGKHLYTGEIFPIAPFNYDKPQTLFGPVYGLLIAPLIDLPWPSAMLIIPLIQTWMLVCTALLIIHMLHPFLKWPWPGVAAIIYILIPFNLLYSTFMMAETLSQLLIVLFLYFFLKSIQKNTFLYPSLIVFVAALATLTRYVFQILLPVSLLWLIIRIILTVRKKHASAFRPLSFIQLLLPAAAGAGIIIYWMWFNFTWNGTWTLSTFSGRHIYDNVVTVGKFLPPDDHPSMKPFIERFPNLKPRDWMIGPWWEKQLAFNDGKTSEIIIDTIMLNVSIAAILHQPFPYAIHVLRVMWAIPTTAPYYPPALIETLNACKESDCPDCPQKMCRFKWNWNLCVPSQRDCGIQSGWAAFTSLNVNFYPVGGAILFILSLIGSLISFIKGKFFLKGVATMYVGLHTLHASTEWVEGRFLIPLYPMYAMLITIAIQHIVIKARHIVLLLRKK